MMRKISFSGKYIAKTVQSKDTFGKWMYFQIDLFLWEL